MVRLPVFALPLLFPPAQVKACRLASSVDASSVLYCRVLAAEPVCGAAVRPLFGFGYLLRQHSCCCCRQCFLRLFFPSMGTSSFSRISLLLPVMELTCSFCGGEFWLRFVFPLLSMLVLPLLSMPVLPGLMRETVVLTIGSTRFHPQQCGHAIPNVFQD